MTANEQDWAVIFDIKRIEAAVRSGAYQEISGVPVLDGRKGSPFTRYVPVSTSPHGCNTAPDGRHVMIAGKLSPTVTVIDEVLHDVEMAIGKGECVALVGHNGAGWTTLLKLVLGLKRPSSGRLRVLGGDPAGAGSVVRRGRIGYGERIPV
jgi:nitrous oxide reductase